MSQVTVKGTSKPKLKTNWSIYVYNWGVLYACYSVQYLPSPPSCNNIFQRGNLFILQLSLYITCGECDYPLLKMPDEGVAP